MLRPGSCGGKRSQTRLGAACFTALLLFTSNLSAQEIPWNLTASLRWSHVTTSRMYYYPDATIPDVRNEHVSLNRLSGFGGEVRVPFLQGFFLSLSCDVITREQSQKGFVFDSVQARLFQAPEIEGIQFIPVEVGICTYIPLGSDDFRLTMGAGFGMYYAVRTYQIAGVSVVQINSSPAVGLHVGVGAEYRLWQSLIVCGALKFRDPEVTSESRFEQTTSVYDGRTVRFPQDPIKTKVNIDGMTFSLGLMLEL